MKQTSGPSKLESAENCGYAYKLRYVEKVQTRSESANLIFGTAGHETVEHWLLGDYSGTPPKDPAEYFIHRYDALMGEKAVKFSSRWTKESLRETGVVLAKLFPAAWRKSGLILAEDDKGPMIERELEVEFREWVLRVKIDLLAVHGPTAKLAVGDIKFPSTESPAGFEMVAGQLTDYQAALDAHASALGIDRVNGLFYFEGIKKVVPKKGRGTGPEWHMSPIAPRRTAAMVEERLQKHARKIREHEQGWYPRQERMAFNSPCSLCDFKDYCYYGKKTGLVFKRTQEPVRVEVDTRVVAEPLVSHLARAVL